MSIEIAVLLAVPAVGAIWSGTLGIGAVLNDIRQRRRIAKISDRLDSTLRPETRTGRHRLIETGRHHLRPTPAHAG
ncbi:MAG TPA: hypothetical protein VHX38_41715 [Pseudonocardiaceae bacterium]|jgi:hypothetical protein|nr:hypothetical protein [Pseudonocardiaceae bacterium]